MAYPYNLADYRMLLYAENSVDMESRLGLFQAFSNLYEHDRELLDDMLAADASSSLQVANNYIQGMTCAQPAYLISNLATGKSKPFYSTDGLWTIGRDPRQSDIAVPDKRLSRCHAALQYSPDQGFILSDLESTNGTYINGKNIKRVCALRDGDRIRIGSSVFHFFSATVNQVDASRDSIDDTESGRTLH